MGRPHEDLPMMVSRSKQIMDFMASNSLFLAKDMNSKLIHEFFPNLFSKIIRIDNQSGKLGIMASLCPKCSPMITAPERDI